jgi:hypothetical protein
MSAKTKRASNEETISVDETGATRILLPLESQDSLSKTTKAFMLIEGAIKVAKKEKGRGSDLDALAHICACFLVSD